MQFSVDRSVLVEAISWSTRAVPQRPPVAILSGLHLQAANGVLTISAFDYETSVKVEVPASIDEPGDVLVSGRMLAEMVKALPNRPVEFTKVDEKSLSLVCGTANFNLATMPVGDYPTLPAFPELCGSVEASELSNAVKQVSIAASKDDTLPLLTGVMVEIDGDNITLLATDRYRLAQRDLKWKPADPSFSTKALVRAKILSDVANTITSAGDISLALSAGNGTGTNDIVGFTAGERSTTSNLMSGEYPPVRRLFPTETLTYAVIDRQGLIDATKRMKLVADRNTPVRLHFTEEGLTLNASNNEEAQGSDFLQVSLRGEEITTAFNPNYLLEGLQAINTPYVRISFTQPTKPAVLHGQEKIDGEVAEDFRYLLMPIRYGV
ncbi:DNA polymerase III subunit beta [Boudabousia tangfeifanii]|uniref:Beta sliding clamp n=1 Tax=Boudabousia tangfeifanii TaxID=1912795 RepID=A0A1D9MI57_9ACTO|nr:DNA polymerase III subunit beta [Boudabousia tangfeifanii]AOZ71870.1 DNA polymerase III subunit beta [Boudabousia tangfeifanii]